MRVRLITLTASLASVLAVPRAAHADPMDPAIERFAHDAADPTVACSDAGLYRAGARPCALDEGAFKRLINQYGFAIAPMAMHPARTTGYGGFQVTVQGAFTSIDSSADYWQNGTQGPRDPTTGQYSVRNKSPDSWLQVYGVNVRKGLPLGFELGANVAYVARTSIVAGGADVRWSLLEGFRRGALGYLPDLAVGGGVRTITGTAQFQLTVASADGVLSKPIPIADTSVLTPYVGYQFLRIFGDSNSVDLTPRTDALGYCNYQGQRVPGGFSGDDVEHTKGPYNGQTVCGDDNSRNGSPEDLSNTRVFEQARITRHRLVVGLAYRFEMIVVGGQFITDVVAPASANQNKEAAALADVPRQSTIGVQVGAAF
ncbi:MAG TPA: hypothetical protein VK550_06210 [Polyangiaceae bacterium]|nr:hypothetical protein [Polyangiaceae bacterium]